MTFCGILNAFELKIIMVFLMVLDHAYYFLFPRELLFAHYLARVVAPVFTFFMAQGMVYTRDRRRYILRLFGFGAAMALGNFILSQITKRNIPNNIFLSLAIGAALIECIDKLIDGRNRPAWLILGVLVFISSYYCEGGYLVPLMAVIFYCLRGNYVLMLCAYIAAAGIPYYMDYLFTGNMKAQFFMIFAVIPIMLYNGKRGPDNAFAKYFFYIVYPLHVWIIVLIKAFLFTS